jgi:hypothetical protein
MRGIAILAIMLHNYCHYVKGIVKENEYQFLERHCDQLWAVMTSPDEFLPMHLLSFFGHYGVPVFLFLSGYGLVMKYESSPVPTVGQRSAVRSAWDFILYHYLKLLRMLIVGFTLFLMVDAVTPGRFPFHWDHVIAQLLMYINVLPEPDKIIWPGIYWFFGLMMELYVVYRLLLYRRRSLYVVLLIALCWLLQAFCEPDGEMLNRLRYNFIGGMLPFGVGIIVARVFSRSEECGVWSENTSSADSAVEATAEHISLHTPHSSLLERTLHFPLLGLLLALASIPLVIVMSFSFHSWLWIPVVIIIGTIAMVKAMPDAILKFFVFFGTYSAAMFVAHPVARKLFITVAWRQDIYDGLMLYVVVAIALSWAVKQIIDRIPSPKQ